MTIRLNDYQHSPPNLSVSFRGFCVKVEEVLEYRRGEDDVRAVKKTVGMCLDPMMETELTILYLKYVPIKGHGVGPLMPPLLNKTYGAIHSWK